MVRPELLEKALGLVLREERLAADLSQRELAGRAGIDRNFLGEIERGGHDPTIATLWKLASALELPSRIAAGTERLFQR